MSVNFNMVGKLQMPKETEKFKPYVERTSESGWTTKRLRFTCVSGTNRHSLGLDALVKADGTNTIYTRRDISTGGRPQSEPMQVAFKDRLKPDIIASVSNFDKYVLDLNPVNRMSRLTKLKKLVEDGSGITDAQLKEVGLTDASEVISAYEAAIKKRKEFITSWDMIDALCELLESGEYSDKNFSIKGSAEYSYNATTDTTYESFVPKKIYLAPDDEVPTASAVYKLLFNKDSLEDNKVTGYHLERNSNYNKNRDPESLKSIPVQEQITLPTAPENADKKTQKRCDAIMKKFTVDDNSWKEVGCDVEMINGSPRVNITYEMLDDDQKDNIDLGLTTLEDIQRELGGAVYGEHIRELRFNKYSYGYSAGPKDTEFTDKDMQIQKETFENDDLDDFDLFN